MKGLTGLPLDDDVVDRVLMFSPDFVTLNNVILTAKAFYNVYTRHPNSIMRAVAYNVVGPALPQALRAIRYPVRDQEDLNAEEQPGNELGDAWDAETGEYGPILPQEVTHLVENAEAFKGLEEHFSLRHKNRRFKNPSQLTFTESYRFQRAMYRITLYCRIFYGPKYVEITDEFALEDEDDGENRDLIDRLEKERKKRKQFLDAFSDEELLQILSVSRFLKEVYFWAGNYPFDPQDDLQETIGDAALSVGPQIIYKCLVDKSNGEVSHAFDYWDYEDGDNNAKPFFSGYLSYRINDLFEERKLKPPPEDPSHWKSILDSIEGEKDACAGCNTVKGFDLCGSSTFEYLSNGMNLEPSMLAARLKGALSSNRVELPYFNSLMSKMPSNETLYEYVIQDILGSNYKQPEFENWKADDWLCMDCVKKVIDENLHLWLLNKRTQAGDNAPSTDCWYGWDCRTQTHKQEHAAKLNHICPPTK